MAGDGGEATGGTGAAQTRAATLLRAHWDSLRDGLRLPSRDQINPRSLAPALAQNVAFMPGEPFFIDPDAHPGHLRLNFSHVAPERLNEGLKRLAAVIREAQAR